MKKMPIPDVHSDTQFILDTNVFIDTELNESLYQNKRYDRNVFKGLIKTFNALLKVERIILLDVVYDELTPPTNVSDKKKPRKHNLEYYEQWANKQTRTIGPTSKEYMRLVRYQEQKQSEFNVSKIGEHEADMRIVAHAMQNRSNFIVVTEESSAKNPSYDSMMKIPNICDAHGIKWMRTIHFFAHALDAKIKPNTHQRFGVDEPVQTTLNFDHHTQG